MSIVYTVRFVVNWPLWSGYFGSWDPLNSGRCRCKEWTFPRVKDIGECPSGQTNSGRCSELAVSVQWVSHSGKELWENVHTLPTAGLVSIPLFTRT